MHRPFIKIFFFKKPSKPQFGGVVNGPHYSTTRLPFVVLSSHTQLKNILLFKGFVFRSDENVDYNKLEQMEEQGGEIPSSSHKESVVWLVNQLIGVNRKHERVFQHWVNMCIHQQKRVDLAPFTIDNTYKKEKIMVSAGDRYDKDEDARLWSFATIAHNGSDMTQEELWKLAEQEDLVGDTQLFPC
jgi:hypothetical protein